MITVTYKLNGLALANVKNASFQPRKGDVIVFPNGDRFIAISTEYHLSHDVLTVQVASV